MLDGADYVMGFVLYNKKHCLYRKLFVLHSYYHETIDDEDED
jgi:hypothetical protein